MSSDPDETKAYIQYVEEPYWGGKPGWYFADETGGLENNGPYASSKEATKAMIEYAKTLG